MVRALNYDIMCGDWAIKEMYSDLYLIAEKE